MIQPYIPIRTVVETLREATGLSWTGSHQRAVVALDYGWRLSYDPDYGELSMWWRVAPAYVSLDMGCHRLADVAARVTPEAIATAKETLRASLLAAWEVAS